MREVGTNDEGGNGTYTHLMLRSLQFEQDCGWGPFVVTTGGRSLRSQRTLRTCRVASQVGWEVGGTHLLMRHAPQAENCCLVDLGWPALRRG